jgi:ATP-dependent RNA helicase DDX49/DBP8
MLSKSEKLVEELKRVEVLVLDEADRLFEEKMLPNMRSIISAMPALRQTLLATATIDENFEGKRLKQLLNIKLDFVKFSTFEGKKTVSTLIQNYIFTTEQLKPGFLMAILKANSKLKIIVFVKTCKECTLICETLQKLELAATQLHSFMKNSQRVANLATFRSGQASVLVTTDLTSRGLDISDVHLVVNYNLPRTVADYVHRVGRTARNGS